MEKIQSICALRDLMLAIHSLEGDLQAQAGVDLKEAMLLCTLSGETVASTEIAKRVGLRPAHTSKLLARLEKLELVVHRLAQDDRRKVLYSLTPTGQSKVSVLRAFTPNLDNLRSALELPYKDK